MNKGRRKAGIKLGKTGKYKIGINPHIPGTTLIPDFEFKDSNRLLWRIFISRINIDGAEDLFEVEFTRENYYNSDHSNTIYLFQSTEYPSLLDCIQGLSLYLNNVLIGMSFHAAKRNKSNKT